MKLCFNGKDFSKPRFISVAVIEGHLVSNSVSVSYMPSEFCFYSSGLCHPISIWCQTPPLGLWRPPWSGSSCIDSRTWENLLVTHKLYLKLFLFCFVFVPWMGFMKEVVEILEFVSEIPGTLETGFFWFIISNPTEASKRTLQSLDSVSSSQHNAPPPKETI